MSNPQEKRRFCRSEIAWPVTLMTSMGPMDGKIQNLGVDGAFIRCSGVPDLDECFRLIIRPGERQLLLANAEMVWSETFSSDDPMFYGMGVCFRYIVDDDRKFISDTLLKHA
ncbi:MAG: PilZ domain-containing protein [Deltaproteobacteria bacterium]|nr:MAG: PilZ domain-containing protein [Deltaproteobacteria bacterium]